MRRSTVWAVVAGAAVVASVIAISAVWPGLDAKSTPAVSAAVWALQTGDGRRYARVNTAIGELDTVRSIANPSAVAQSDSGAYVFSESFGKLTRINDALPANLDDEALRSSASTPAGTVDVAVSGDWVAYRTDSGAVFVGTLSGGGATQIDPNSNGDAQAPEYTSDAITVDDSGMLYSYSAADATVLRYRIGAAEVAGRDAVRDGPKRSESDLTAAGGVWFLVDPQQGQVWHRGSDTPQSIGVVAGDVAYGRSTASGDAAWLADSSGLIKLPIDGSPPAREVGGQDTSKGRPARPIVFGGDVYAAWLGTTSGTLWRSGGQGESTLDYGGRTLGTDLRPVFVASDSSMILNETRSGWVWATPTGKLMPSSQNWALDDQTNPQTQPSNEQAAVVIDPKPPVAEPDTFGVRAGSLAALPVLLNDHDPNRDVLSIDPTSVTGLDPGFGTLSITDNGQRIAVQTAAGATGSATFSYRVTDGTAVDGLYSDPTTVTLTVAPNAQNSAPEWCSTPGCLATWPAPEVASGGTVTIPVMDGWVDPEGDPLMLLSVVNESGIGSVASTPAGEVVYQHPNASITDVQNIQLQVTVADTRGAATTKPLTVRVSPTPKLTATSFTVIDAQSSGTTIDVGTHVTGTAGKLSLSSVRVLDDARAEVVATAGSTSFDFTAQAPGTYRVSYTVSDGVSDANATARVTILPADAAAQLATAPVVAFVRPKEDVTVDVFTAVTNPTHRVLLLSNVVPSASPGASMSVDAVGQNYIRVSGATADGAPGLLGTIRYVVSDGTEDAGARIEGQATVYLLPPAPELAPIAVDDSVVVRAGAQIDIPVLDNDVAIAGGSMILNPASVRSSSDQALAFASGRTLRYLAPSTPGDYTVEYAVYTAGSPALADTATVHVSVISEESNRAPRPGTLEGRVLSGELTSIPFRSFGVDPDGDAVSLDRIVTQPASGSATLSADGESIVYSSVPGFRGQVSFTYRVTDSQGATGTATARVGVLDEQSNPSPVTFTDYVQLQVGAENSVRVSPLANDVDPTGGTLSITAVTPDVVQTLADGTPNDEFDRLSGLIATPSATEVVIRAGTTPGTMSFLYDVQSSSGNTARGLIVVKVVRESVPDFPVITDTVLTAQTRDRFPSGVDVVAGKVSWTGGNISDLTLSLWGAPAGVSVEGTRLRGDLPARTLVIPFALTGTSASGQNVTSYGFLRIPGENDLALALRTGLADRQVEERASVSWNMLDLVGVPRGATIEVGDDVRPSGARTGAACVRESGTTIRYDAGAGAPWQDACIVPVRITGREDWTYLSVPVRVQALVPQPELTSASLTVAPGQTVTYDLAQLTTWQGGIAGTGVAYSVAYTGTRFVVTQQGSIVTVVGADDAVPGAEDAAIIGVTSQAAVAPARLILRVGAAPSTLPQGGTIAQQCSQASGSSCTFTVIGAGGEINPLPRTPLTVTSVRPTGACVGVSFSVVSATAVTATWTADAPGATCTAAFSVRDAQGRQTNSERDGQILLDLQGYPKAPSSITQTAYADGTLTLRVDPGDARLAYPALSSFVVRSQGAVVANCSAEGICPVISAPNGEQRVYEAAAVNGVGESAIRVSTTAWAYIPPPAPQTVTAAPVVTAGDGGVVSLQIGGIDLAQTGHLLITSPAGDTTRVDVGSSANASVPSYRVGSNTQSVVTVTPYSRFAVPSGLAGSPSGSARTVTTNGIGRPLTPVLTLTSTSNGDGTSTISASGSATPNGDGSTIRFGIVAGGDPSPCTASTNGASASFTVLDGNEYTYSLCAESWLGSTSFGRSETSGTVRAVQSGRAPRGYTFVVAAAPDVQTGTAYWRVKDAPTSTEPVPRNNRVEVQGLPSSVIGADPGIRVRYVHTVWGTVTAWSTATAAPGSAPYQVRADWSVRACTAGSPLATTSSSTNGQAVVAIDTSRAVYTDAAGTPITPDGSGNVPAGATAVTGLTVTVDWSAQGWGLNSVTQTFGGTCTP